MSGHASLNHIYRTVWNQALGAMVAVAEIASSGGRGNSGSGVSTTRSLSPLLLTSRFAVLSLGVAIAWGLSTSMGFANPTGGVAIVGQASMLNQGNKLTVTTQNGAGTNHSAINWQSFSIPSGSTTYFQQPGANSTSINRVVTNTPSQLFGTLGSNGKLVLVNQSGIAVGAGAVVDTAGFTASSLRMSDADALAGRLLFGDGLASSAAVSVQGRILARSGDVVLLGSSVDTGKDALIQAPNGSTILAAGRQIELTGRGLEGISLQVQAPTDQAVNLGTLKGDAVAIFAGTLRHSGLIQASTATMEGGRVVLKASGDAYIEGTGTITATGTKGGSVDMLGNRVALTDQATIDASGEKGGGTARVGGDYQGKNPEVANARMTYVGPQAHIKADALDQGDGGKVIVWADDTTRAYGSISARGGANGGKGGLVETSAHHLDVNGIVVDAHAPHGNAGSWLMDPINVSVVSTPDTGGILGGTGSGTWTPSASGSAVSSASIQNALNIGTTVIITTTGALTEAGDITVNAPISMSASMTASLRLEAANNIAVNAAIGSSTGALSLVLDHGATGSATLASTLSLAGGSLDVRKSGSGGAGTLNVTGGTTTLTGALTASTLNISNGTLTLNAGAATTTNLTTLKMTGGTLGGTSNAVVATGGSFDWTGGTIAGHLTTNGATAVSSGSFTLGARALWDNAGGVTITSGGWGFVGTSATWNNSGSVDIGSNFGINFNGTSGAQFNNLAAGTVTLSGTYSSPITGTGGVFNNAGTFGKTSTATQSITNTSNTGTINVTVGTLDLVGNWTNTGVINLSGGTLKLSSGFTPATFRPTSGALNRTGGSIELSGTLDNSATGSSVDLGSSGLFGTGGLSSLSGTIKGGTVISSDTTPTLTSSSGTLDGVILGDATRNTLTTAGSLYINNGLTLASGMTLNKGNGTWYFGTTGLQHIAAMLEEHFIRVIRRVAPCRLTLV
ncbi:MAG: filamentous hemagglutinin N-terminal domain-containing protein [Burkholderiales bacterium]|nr:filamentous hemagglutinin N-terminal domain-containing protein [Burkholderiales bacterium]